MQKYKFINFLPETGGLFNLAVRLMQLFSECKEDFTPLASILGLYFQIRDDYCNLYLQEVNNFKDKHLII